MLPVVRILQSSIMFGSLRSQVGARTAMAELGLYLRARNISNPPEFLASLSCDGYIEPFGKNYDSGFRLYLRQNSPESRLRFTVAHEICHTFFYELVPEIKLVVHETDRTEEQICNIGAAELLISNDDLMNQKAVHVPHFRSLENLARRYGSVWKPCF